MVVVAGFLALLLALVHVLGGRPQFLDVIPRSRWLSGAGGVSVAYVFLHVLPHLAESQEAVRASAGGALGLVEHHVYLIALLGMTAFYGLERLAKRSRARSVDAGAGDATEAGAFWIHVGSFTLYNLLIGYLLIHREESDDPRSLLLFFAAMATHFLVNDFGLRQDHKRRYDHVGRWLLAAAVLAGWAVGTAVEVHRAAVAVLFSFLAGGVMLNVLKEELPEERKSNFWAFAVGAAAYAALLIAA